MDLRDNNLETLPTSLLKLASSRVVLIEGNQFDCRDCHQVDILRRITAVTPQNVTCKNQDVFQRREVNSLIRGTILKNITIKI
jgi:tartrate dehydratase beta subunit/fumarate hydratase class I family protein